MKKFAGIAVILSVLLVLTGCSLLGLGGDSGGGGGGSFLPEGVWVSGNLTRANQVHVYTMQVSAWTTYRIWVNSGWTGWGNGTQTADVDISIDGYNFGGSTWLNTDLWNSPATVTPSSSGTLTLRVRPWNQSSGSTGTYRIVYSSGTTRPW